jgi:predicted nucleotidyltransferase
MASTNRETEVLELVRTCLSGFADRLRGYRIVLFGSRAAGTAGPRADFDLGVEGPVPLPLDTFCRVRDALEELPTLYSIDWVDLQRVTPQFRQEAMQHSRTLYEA